MFGLRKVFRCKKGASAIEYALVVALISIAGLAAYQNLGNRINTMYNNVSNNM